ncbi:MAG: hypothetical protein H6607_10300 [Flavobacteriales bacterium]|nr:hypothetical protein [Flavobacteriales bacterium]
MLITIKNAVFIAFMCILSAMAFGQKYDLNHFQARYQEYKGFNLDFDLTSAGKGVDFTRSINQSSKTNRFGLHPSYFVLMNTDLVQRNMNLLVFQDFSKHNTVINNLKGNSDITNSSTFGILTDTRKYREKRFKYREINLVSTYNWSGFENLEPLHIYYTSYTIAMPMSFAFGFGNGRLNMVTDAVQAMFILENLKSNKDFDYSNEQIESVAKGITEIRNARYLDSRIGLKKQIKALDSILSVNGISADKNIDYYSILYDNWQFANRFYRYSGSRWTHYSQMYGYYQRKIDNVLTYSDTGKVYSYSAEQNVIPSYFIHSKYESSSQRSLYEQFGYFFHFQGGVNFPFRSSDNVTQTAPIRKIDKRLDEDFSNFYIETNFGTGFNYLFQPNTRNIFTSQISLDLNHKRIETLKLSSIFPRFTSVYYHWFSPQLNINATASFETIIQMLGPVKALKKASDNYYYNIHIGLSYQLF